MSDADEQFRLNKLARPLDLWIGIHKSFDPARGGGPFYCMRRKESKERLPGNPTIAKYQTAEQIEACLLDYAEFYAEHGR